MIEIRGLAKSYGPRLAVGGIDLVVPRGRIFGLLGHNGAGKSTTIGCLLGHLFPDRGSIRVNGTDALADRRLALARVGAIFETPAFYEYLSGLRNLRIFAECTAPVPERRLLEVARIVGLVDRIRDRVGRYSHGMRQRLALAQALLPDPELLIVDEPTDGLDPEGIHEIRTLLLDLNREHSLTILLSSHLLSEVELLCTDIAVMRQGRLLYSGPMSGLPRTEGWIILRTAPSGRAQQLLRAKGWVEEQRGEDRIRLRSGIGVADAVDVAVAAGLRIEAAHPIEMTLEEFYLQTVHGDQDA
jgi:ABC-2 type transport system ATP-binding protein